MKLNTQEQTVGYTYRLSRILRGLWRPHRHTYLEQYGGTLVRGLSAYLPSSASGTSIAVCLLAGAAAQHIERERTANALF